MIYLTQLGRQEKGDGKERKKGEREGGALSIQQDLQLVQKSGLICLDQGCSR